MATGTGWQQQYSPASGNPPSTTGLGNNPSSSTNLFYETGLTMEYTQDLHLKMSKKIAQLTKVSSGSLRLLGDAALFVQGVAPVLRYLFSCLIYPYPTS